MANVGNWISLGITWFFGVVIFLRNAQLRRLLEEALLRERMALQDLIAAEKSKARVLAMAQDSSDRTMWALNGLELMLQWAGIECPQCHQAKGHKMDCTEPYWGRVRAEAEEPSHREQTSNGNQTEGVIDNLG